MACKTFHKGKYFVTFKRGFEDYKKDITVTINKVFENDSLRISLSDDDDPSFLCVLHVSRCDYEDLKRQQGLLIDFDNFPAQFVRLLQQCAVNNMFLIMQQANPIQYHFEIVEHNEFKRLVHLSLKTGPATDADIKLHMANTINDLKKLLSAQKTFSESSETTWSEKVKCLERKVSELVMTIAKLNEDIVRREDEFQDMIKSERDKLIQERTLWQKNCDMTLKNHQASSQDIINTKDQQIEECNVICRQLKDNVSQLEVQLSEKSQRLNVLENEVQKSHIEVVTLKAKNASLEREAVEHEKIYNQISAKCGFLEKAVKDNSDILRDLNNSLSQAKREKTSLEERLAISESLASRNNEAAHSTSEQLMKANQIISKLNTDMIEIKEKLLCRTAIALEQEKVIERNTSEIADLKSQVLTARQTVEQLEKKLIAVQDKCESNEKAMQDRDETIRNNNMVIQWLHKKMDGHPMPSDVVQNKLKSGIQSATSSTPYFVQRNSNPINLSDPTSEESINFYATSKISNNNEDSSRDEMQEKPNRFGLDPKYLKPASEDNVKSAKGKSKTPSENTKGKENKDFQLPKVDYREKKSSRPTTFRATPASAYFP